MGYTYGVEVDLELVLEDAPLDEIISNAPQPLADFIPELFKQAGELGVVDELEGELEKLGYVKAGGQ